VFVQVSARIGGCGVDHVSGRAYSHRVPEPLLAAPDGRPLTELTRDELVALVEAQQAGIRIQFPGKDVARSLARRVRPRVSRTLAKYSVGDPEQQARNIVVEGDNLQAMVSLYRYRGQVDLVLTDPPYNTGNDWRYNDRWDTDPNDPGLGQWIGPDDAGRHTKWMKFMYPRLQMMRAMLKPTGVLAICIDHRELFRLGQMLDEIFGEKNRIAIINWQKATALKNDNSHVSTSTEYVLVYAKNEERARTGPLDRTTSQNSRYSNPDNDPRCQWREGMLAVRTWVAKDDYAIQSPFTGDLHYPQGKSAWRHPKRHIKSWLEEWGSPYVEQDRGDDHAPALILKNGFSRATQQAAERVLEAGPWPFIWFGRQGDGIPRKKIYLAEVRAGKIPETFWATDDLTTAELLPEELGSTSWAYQESGRSSDGAAELTAIVGEDHRFETVKPLKLFAKLVTIWCPPDGLVLDPFAGSGTTGHAVLAMNEAATALRRFILIEQGRPDRGDSYARTLVADRLRRAIYGNWASGKGTPLVGGFRFVQLQKKVDADTVLRMERDELLDTVIASHYDSNRRRGPGLVSMSEEGYRYLIAKNTDKEGFFLVWGGPDKNTDFTEDVYEAIAKEAKRAALGATYHVYARLYVFQTENVRFYQIPDRILADFGLNLSSEPFNEELS
jgi:adenine-specific DNA-methyltransferase